MPLTYERIESLCKEKGINVTALCTNCGIPRASLSDYKSGRKKTLSAKTLSLIADYFGVSVDFLYGKTDNQKDNTALKVALFGGDSVVTDEMWDEVKRYAEYIKERENGNK
ncbi:MAG: helix-turn-helix transcriptional regulator [Clostridia bacterium]|nr:helix-turn-helix transcriptional regulator [Clostridia bacterium]